MKRLLASIHDVGPRFEREVDLLAERLDALVGEARFAMLVVPDHWGAAPLAEAAAYRRRLLGWAKAGVEMFVHGWYHKDLAEHGGAAAFKARHMTAGEGEFLGLSEAVGPALSAAGGPWGGPWPRTGKRRTEGAVGSMQLLLYTARAGQHVLTAWRRL